MDRSDLYFTVKTSPLKRNDISTTIKRFKMLCDEKKQNYTEYLESRIAVKAMFNAESKNDKFFIYIRKCSSFIFKKNKIRSIHLRHCNIFFQKNDFFRC